MTFRGLAAVSAAAFVLAGASSADATEPTSITIQAAHQGEYREDGRLFLGSTNAGWFGFQAHEESRAWYEFSTAIGFAPASSISITFYGADCIPCRLGALTPGGEFSNVGYLTGDFSETIGLFDFTGSVSNLVSGANGINTFDDLGHGAQLAEHTITAANLTPMPTFTVNLSQAFVDQFNSTRGGDERIALGAALTTIDHASFDQLFWRGAYGPDYPAAFLTVQLLQPMETVPEPSTWAMMIMGFAGAGAVLRRRRSYRLIGSN